MTGTPVQLPLQISLRDEYTIGNFLAGPNSEALAAIERQQSGAPDTHAFVYLWGEGSSGKSHLLQAACHAADDQDLRAIYLPLIELGGHDPELLDGLELVDLVCIDDLQEIAGNRAWEECLFRLYNRMREAGSRLLLAAEKSPRGLGLQLPDLVSRFSQCMVLQVQPLTPDQGIDVFRARAGDRGIEVQDSVAEFIANRSPRDLCALMGLLDELDRASLVAKRRLTVPFVKQVMGW